MCCCSIRTRRRLSSLVLTAILTWTLTHKSDSWSVALSLHLQPFALAQRLYFIFNHHHIGCWSFRGRWDGLPLAAPKFKMAGCTSKIHQNAHKCRQIKKKILGLITPDIQWKGGENSKATVYEMDGGKYHKKEKGTQLKKLMGICTTFEEFLSGMTLK